ncbi:MAG: fatty acid cis/trans isomerase [bacterium]
MSMRWKAGGGVWGLLVVAFVGCARIVAPPPAPTPPQLTVPAAGAVVSFRDQVKPILDQRCVVCHACNDAPCQLLLSSPQGVRRGASKTSVYDTDRLHAAPPTRLFIDAQHTEEWRQLGFFPVSGAAGASGEASLMGLMLALGRAHTFASGEKLPAAVGLDLERPLTCAQPDQFAAYAAAQPLGGMPYGTAPLTDAELGVLAAWLAQGAPAPDEAPPLPPSATSQVATWEAFLNGTSLKQRITARYLYEHWFLAHLYFESLPDGPFFRVVRSRTPPGQPIDEIASRRPYDDPGAAAFWYRLRPLDETIVHKTHIIYPLSPQKLDRLTALFLTPAWQPTGLPSYAADEASNPFLAFAQIPPRARYQYMLDNAQYFVMTFIRGPVCRGEVAVDVIEDHFFVAFMAPDHDLAITQPGFLQHTASDLNLPAEHLSRLAPGEFWLQYDVEQRRFLRLRQQYLDAADPRRQGPALDYLWDGDGSNRNAQLTVFRHFDNATVVQGFLGATPKTAWVLDYALFERIYYDLVAGYDVFGSIETQVATRLYMDHLRMQGEDLFLSFLPADQRAAIRASWYVGATDSLDYRHVDTLHSLNDGTQIAFATADPKAELLAMLLARNAAVSGPPDLLNRCGAPPCDRPGASPLEQRAERALQPLAGVRGPWVATLPEVALLRVHGNGDDDAVYTLVHNRDHTNVAFLLDEAARLVPAQDTLTLAPGYLGSYPNFAFDVDVTQIDAFAHALAAVHTTADFETVVVRWGVRRTSPNFWATSDWLQANFKRREPTAAGVLDLDRYDNL